MPGLRGFKLACQADEQVFAAVIGDELDANRQNGLAGLDAPAERQRNGRLAGNAPRHGKQPEHRCRVVAGADRRWKLLHGRRYQYVETGGPPFRATAHTCTEPLDGGVYVERAIPAPFLGSFPCGRLDVVGLQLTAKPLFPNGKARSQAARGDDPQGQP